MNVEFHRQNLTLVNNTNLYTNISPYFLIRCSVQNMKEQNSFSKLEHCMLSDYLTVTKILTTCVVNICACNSSLPPNHYAAGSYYLLLFNSVFWPKF